jgi:CRP-like cAMP-binding protein
MNIDKEWLKKHSQLPEINDTVLDELLSIAKSAEYTDGDILYTNLETVDTILMVTEGCLTRRSALLDFDGEDLEEMKLQAGEFGNIVRLISDLPSTVTCTALGEVKVLSWHVDDLKKILEKDPEINLKIIKETAAELVQRLYNLDQKLLDNVSWGLA